MSILDFFRPNRRLEQQVERLREESRQLKELVESLRPAGGKSLAGNGADFAPAGDDTGAAENSVRPNEDFASAVSSAVDSLQTELSQMTNSVSNFAVREVTLQAKVSLEVTPLGGLNYKFVRPEDQVDPQKLSTISMTVVPIPKPDIPGAQGTVRVNTQAGLDELEGMDESQRGRLRQLNIYTVGEFLRVGTRARSAVQLAALLEVDRKGLDELLSHAQLLTLKGVDGQTARALFDAGVRGFQDLASLTPEEVLSRYIRSASALGQAALERPTLAQVAIWVNTARAYVGATDQPADAMDGQ